MAVPAGNDPMEPSFDPVGELKVPSRKPSDAQEGGAPAQPDAAETPMPEAAAPEPPAAKAPAVEPPGEPALQMDLESLRIRPDQSPADVSRGGGGPWKFLFVLLLLAGGGYVVWQEVLPRVEKAQRPHVTVATARLATLREQKVAGAFSAGGWIKLPQYHPVYVTPLIEGLVEELFVIEGDAVEKGQVIARLYEKDYCAECEAAEAAVEASEAKVEAAVAAHDKMKAGYRKQEVAEAKAAVDRLDAELDTARQILEHSEKLRPSGAISEEELLRDRLRVKTLEADREKARQVLARMEEGFRTEDIALAMATLQQAKADLEQAKAERDLAQLKLGYVEIKSPMQGVVLQRLASRGQWVKPADGRLVSLYDPTDLEASVDISQDDLGRVFLDQTVEIITRAEPDRMYEGTVVLIEPQADLVKNTVPVRVKLHAKPGDLLFPDMVVKARFLPKEGEAKPTPEEDLEPVLTVPQNAVFADAGKTFVLVVKSGKTARREVQVGSPAKGRIVVEAGLEDGEVVVTSNPGAIPDGEAVEIAR